MDSPILNDERQTRFETEAEASVNESRTSPPNLNRNLSIFHDIKRYNEDLVEEDDDNEWNALSIKGVLNVSCYSGLLTYLVKLLLRGALIDRQWFVKLDPKQRSVFELHLLGALHGFGVTFFALNKLITNTTSGTSRMLCLSLGYFVHNMCSGQIALNLQTLDHLSSVMTIICVLRSHFNQRRFVLSWFGLDEIPKIPLYIILILQRVEAIQTSLGSVATSSFLIALICCRIVGMPFLLLYSVFRKQNKKSITFLFAALLKIIVNGSYAIQALSILRSNKIRFRGNKKTNEKISKGMQHYLYSNIVHLITVPIFALFHYGYLASIAIPFWLRNIFMTKGLNSTKMYSLLGLALTAWSVVDKQPKDLPEGVPLPSNFLKDFGPGPEKLFKDYFKMKFVFEEETPKDAKVLICVHPHGVTPAGKICHEEILREQGFRPQTIGASVLFKLPFIKQIVGWGGVIEAKPSAILKGMTRPYPSNVMYIVPGGIAEMFFVNDKYEHIVLNGRKGFIKLAMMGGADLVPCYIYGHTRMFKTATGMVQKLFEKLSRALQMSIIPFYGRFGLLVPLPTPTLCVQGKRIHVQKNPSPTQEQIDALHEEYVAALKELYYKYRHLAPGYENTELFLDGDKIPKDLRSDTEVSGQFSQFPDMHPIVKSFSSSAELEEQTRDEANPRSRL